MCQEYGKKFSMMFNAAKSAWLYFKEGKQPHARVPQFSIDGKHIECTSEYSHLVISYPPTWMTIEILSKRTSLSGKINNVLRYFCSCNPEVKLKLLRSYCSDFYGNVLWDVAYPSVEDLKG